MIPYRPNKLLAKTEQNVNKIDVHSFSGISYQNTHPFLTAFARRRLNPSSRPKKQFRFFHTLRPLY